MLKLFSITFLILLNSFYVSSLKSEDICIKTVKYDGNYYGLSNCNGTLNYDCSKFECARNAFLCEEYQQMIKYMTLGRRIPFFPCFSLFPTKKINRLRKN